jgi:hypothetical protein|eukprot:COSAG06_NODE_873_length_11839_cov_12.053658_5_plen_1162_part_00
MATPRGRTASAVVFGLQGQERTEEDDHFARAVSFKLNASTDFAIAEEEEAEEETDDSSSADSDETPVRAKFVQPQRSSLRNRSNDALAGLGQLAINANQSPRAKRGYTKKSTVVKRQGSAVPTPPKTALPSSEKPGSTIQWKSYDGAVSVSYEGEGMTYLCSLYPQGPGALDWRADVEWAGTGEPRLESQQLYMSFQPRNGWKFGSCDGWGTLTMAPPEARKVGSSVRIGASPKQKNIYDGQVEGPGAPGPQIHMNLETGVVSTPAPMLRAHGKGKMRYVNGDRYDGQWVNTRREGQGKHKAKGGVHQGTYEGAWAKDMRSGAGRYIDKDGNMLLGRWENNVPREGVMEWSTGDVYDGWWSGKCEWVISSDKTGAADQRCGNIASYGSRDDGVRCRCFEHKKESHVLLNPYKRQGHGTMKWTDGAVYQGQWENDKRHHKGVMRYGTTNPIWSDGDVFEGLWRWDKIADGFDGTMTFADGGLYVGKWFNGVQHNEGIHTYPNGDVFEGEFEQGPRRDGHGKMKYANGDVYVGQWLADLRHGEGKMEYANGDVYTGQWEKGMHLIGKRKYEETAHVYDGEWLDDQPHGHGKMVYGTDWREGTASMKDGDVYEGPWENGTHAAGEVYIVYQNGDSYRGEYEKSLRHGQGRMEYAHGNIFEGTWVRGARRAGWVRAQIPNLGLYEGDWKDERPHGVGTLSFEDTGFYEGDWLKGQRHGQGTMSNGPWRSYTGAWLYDKFDGEGVLTDLRSCSTYTGGFKSGLKHGKAHETYGFIDAEFEGSWDMEVKRHGIFTFPDGTRWERTYDASGKLEKEVLLGDKLTWKTATARAFANSRQLIAGDVEKVSVGEIYADQDCVADDSGRPVKTPSMLPHLGKSPYQNMGRQPPVALTSVRRAPDPSARPAGRPMTNADLPSFLRQKTTRSLQQAISDAAQAARLAKAIDWGIDEVDATHSKMDDELEQHHEVAAKGLEAHNEVLMQREREMQELAATHTEEAERFSKSTSEAIDKAEARQAKTNEELASMGVLDTTEKEEDIDRSEIDINPRGSLEAHSDVPELWQLSNAEVDLNQHYDTGGQLWYLQARAQRQLAEGKQIKGKPLNKLARESGREFDPDLSKQTNPPPPHLPCTHRSCCFAAPTFSSALGVCRIPPRVMMAFCLLRAQYCI